MRQHSLFPREAPPIFGGELASGKRKTARPLSRKRPLHLVLKASRPYLFWNRQLVEGEVRRYAERFGLRVYGLAVAEDHLHLVLKIPSRESFRAFVRALTGVLARRWGKGFWKRLPFTRVMTWGRDFQAGIAYLRKNREEAFGLRDYEPRRDWHRRWRPKEGGARL